MDWTWPGIVISFICAQILTEIIKPYLNLKAQNLATKEDAAEITRKVEGVKAEIEQIRDLELHRYREQFGIVKDIWKSAVRTRNLVMSLRPVMSLGPRPTRDSEEGRRLYLQYVDVYNEFSETLDASGPFIPVRVYDGLCEVRRSISKEGTSYIMWDPDTFTKYWDQAGENQDRIRVIIDQAMKDLRYWLRTEDHQEEKGTQLAESGKKP